MISTQQKSPVDVNLRGFECGGRSRNRTGVGGFAIRYYFNTNQQLTDISIPQMLQFHAPERQASKGFDFEMRNRFNPPFLRFIDSTTLIN